MKIRRKVLLVIDSYQREQLGAVRLSIALKKYGFIVELCDRRFFRQAFERILPNAVILPKLHKIGGIDEVDLSQTKVFLLSAESFTGSEAGIRSYFETIVPNDVFSKLTGIFCWGEKDYSEIGKLIGSRNIDLYITGHPSTDLWYQKSHSDQSAKSDGKFTATIGITTSLRALTHSQKPTTVVETIVSLENSGSSGFYDPPNHCEIWIAYEASFIRIIHNLASANPSVRFLIRVHPNESLEEYLALGNLHSNVEASKGGTFSEWVANIDTLFTAYSTSMLDAAIFGKPVYSLIGLIPTYIIDRLPAAITGMQFYKLFPEVKSFDLSNISEKPYAYQSEGVSCFLKSVFNFPAQELPSLRIARILDEQVGINVMGARQRNAKGRGFDFRKLFYMDRMQSLYADARTLFRDDAYFKPHRIIRNYRIQKRADCVIGK